MSSIGEWFKRLDEEAKQHKMMSWSNWLILNIVLGAVTAGGFIPITLIWLVIRLRALGR